jgi:hypothetical protein
MVQAEEELREKDKVATNERIAWFVINQQSQADGGKLVGVVDGVTNEESQISWDSEMEGTPAFFSQMQGFVGQDTATMRMVSVDQDGAEVFVEEETSDN